MSLPGNGIFVVRGEMCTLMTAMRRGARWSSHSHQDDDDPLMKNFQELKEILNKIDDLRLVQPNIYLGPFLEVIRSEETTGPVTSLALSAVNKFLAYGLIDPTHSSVPTTVHSIADAVTHARFVGTDQSSDGVVLMRILQVLRTLTLAPEGATLTNESLCEIMLSCFRICFETRLNELLRRTAEHYLKDMVQLVFMRLPQFSEDLCAVKQFKMRPGAIEQTRTKRKKSFRLSKLEETPSPPTQLKPQNRTNHLSTTPMTPAGNIVDMQGSISQITPENATESPSNFDSNVQINVEPPSPDHEEETTVPEIEEAHDYINQRGIRFTQQMGEEVVLAPYGLACVRELFRFLISLCNPLEKQNTDVMIHLGLTLLTVAFEVGADSIGKYSPLLALVRDDLCRNLFSLLSSERLSVFAADLQVCFLMFEALRTHLKFQLEFYLTKLIDIIVTDSGKISYEHKEIALDNILQLWRIPGLVTELYLNYDCNLYCTNLYEDLTKLLAKNAFSATSGVYHTHMLSLDALLTVIESIEQHCFEKSETLEEGAKLESSTENIETITNFIGKTTRQKISDQIPSKDELMAQKNIKKWLPTGTEHFNHKPKKGIQFLQEHGVLKNELDPHEIALFLKENSGLDKKMIGEYLGNRSNVTILDAFLKTFDFTNTRIDEALRHYLETFRLPGEAPIISHLMEHFAEHWHKSNGEPFVDVDAAFTLAYAVIILNVDQHNQNAKKQKTPMTLAGFKKNLKGVNGGNDFDEDMLDEIYNAIRTDEIVMPAEQTGLVRENYLWKVLLRKGASKDGVYYHVNGGQFDQELFALIWAPIVAALSFVFDKSEEQPIYKKAMMGFQKCAFISSHFAMSKNLDMLIQTLAKFTNFHNLQRPNNGVIMFGGNVKARLALKCVLDLCHQHGDNIREGWKNLFDLVLSLYILGLLPKSYIEAEDFIESSGKIVLIYEEVENLQKQESGLFSSLYSYMVSSENLSRVPTVEEQQHMDVAKETIKECNFDLVITDSKFLHDESLKALVGALIELSRPPDVQKSLGYNYNENVAVFFLELLIKIVIQNRDRVMTIWQTVRDHIYTLVMNSSVFDYQFLLERSVIGLLRIANRLMRNEDMSPIVLQSLQMLLLLKSSTLCRISRQISFGLYELLKTSAQNIHTETDWTIIFTLLECVGAGAVPPKPIADDHPTTKSDGEGVASDDDTPDRGYTSDSELSKSPKHRPQSPACGWILVGNEGEIQPVVGRTLPPSQYSLALERNLGPHDPSSLIKCCESLAFLVRDVAHITPYNFDDCVHCIRTFVEASLHGNRRQRRGKEARGRRQRRKGAERRSPTSSPDEESDEEEVPSGYHQISIQLLDLMHTLHTRTAQIFKWWAEEGGALAKETSLWTQGWCPLLQGIARLCCDIRREIRMSAITYLQRALLVHDLQTLTGPEWEACFHRVLFPLLAHLLTNIDPKDPMAMEETRMRAATVLSKVFLHHLTPLLSLPTFSNLWLVILDFIDKYMHADKSDLLAEAIPESLKNMLLVMDSAKVFEGADGKSPLWMATWDRINKFLPGMKEELFREQQGKRENVEVLQHNIENATKSIILQPPSSQQQVSSPLFAHLGQMVSTPIASAPPPPPPFLQPTLQPGMPYLYAKNQSHTFPVLYNSPVSLYSEYVGNPYNNATTEEENAPNLLDVNKNNDLVESDAPNNNTNVFQSSNYFSSDSGGDFIPPGSEILFGTEQGNFIPVCTNSDIKTSDV
ncbi:Golgi-specific brefeldin A-resistance guanine nucleotide exchange factor 1 [Tribolium madens]|uniref:Golgi-specific brefeldin A-resistance guanine nucleotide exchange factor 1 n=1 Tax=Tribolium madens TaxID=41895 RepID=UPI001CF72AAF|nr:Golgi-specific brefeldin A-resistance guanine nucleotide exchange factor 1 [Tribolium madens]